MRTCWITLCWFGFEVTPSNLLEGDVKVILKLVKNSTLNLIDVLVQHHGPAEVVVEEAE